MANNPTHEDLLNAIKDGFAHFNQKIPMVTMELVGPIHREPYVKDDAENEWCWMSIDEQAVDDRILNYTKYMGSVSSRGDNLFAAMVTYSLCKGFGETIYDDAGYLNARQEFSLAEFEEMLRVKLDGPI
jgi:hypothetical protein